MKSTSAPRLMLILVLTITILLNNPQLPGVPDVIAQEMTIPAFVNNNTVVLEGGAQPQWLDPHVSYYQYDYQILQHSVEMLLWYNGSSSTQVIPWLTETWTPSYSTTSTTYTVKLRPNIRFQDGTPLNSTAVYFSLNRLLIMDGTSDTEEEHAVED